MGSWNETCAISNLPICPGDRVKLILLENVVTETGKTACYHDEIEAPFAFPISGEYGDYGRVEGFDEKGIECAIILEALSERHVPVKAGENQYHERAVLKLDKWKTLEEGLQDGRVLLKHRYGPTSSEDRFRPSKVHITKVMVREDVWNELLEEVKTWDGKTITLDALFQEAVEHFQKHMEHVETVNRLRAEGRIEELSVAAFGMVMDTTGFGSYFRGSMSGSPGPSAIMKIVKERLANGSMTLEQPEFLRICRGLAEIVLSRHALSQLRFTWHVTSGTGSQEQEFLNYASWYAKLSKIAVDIERTRLEEWGDEDEQRDLYAEQRALLQAALDAIPPPPVPKKKKKATRKTKKK